MEFNARFAGNGIADLYLPDHRAHPDTPRRLDAAGSICRLYCVDVARELMTAVKEMKNGFNILNYLLIVIVVLGVLNIIFR